MKKGIVITYDNGSTIIIDIPETYYSDNYANKSAHRLHKIFLKEYKNFIAALNKKTKIVEVFKYLKFSNAVISAEHVLGVDIKIFNDEVEGVASNIIVPELNRKVAIDVSETSLDTILKQLESTQLISHLDLLIRKLSNTITAKKHTSQDKNV